MIRKCLIALSLATAATMAVSVPVQAQIIKDPLPTRVPEPGMLAMFGAGLVGVAILRRRKRNRS